MKNSNSLISTVKDNCPTLYKIVQFSLVLAVICLGGLIIDDRTLAGVNVWLKPFKFSVSTAIYIITLGYLVHLYPFSDRKKRIINGTVAWTLIVELLIIVVQGARGVQSHYNQNSALDGILFAAMGILIAINVLIMVFLLIETVRLKMAISKPVQWSVFLAWTVVIIGSYIGGQMISQMAHNVGVADGGSGLPLVNWSTKGGDLRIAHFFALHSLQIIPLFAYYLSQRWDTKDINRILVVTLFALIYGGLIGFVFYQAKMGMPLIALS